MENQNTGTPPSGSKAGLVILIITALAILLYFTQRMGCGPVQEREEIRMID